MIHSLLFCTHKNTLKWNIIRSHFSTLKELMSWRHWNIFILCSSIQTIIAYKKLFQHVLKMRKLILNLWSFCKILDTIFSDIIFKPIFVWKICFFQGHVTIASLSNHNASHFPRKDTLVFIICFHRTNNHFKSVMRERL